MATTTIPRLKQRYREELVPRLKDELALGNIMQVPRPSKITINMGVGEAVKDAKLIEAAVKDLTIISGQKPLVTKARKSIANFKLRDRLLSIALPRIRDFRGLPTRMDGSGNYTFGVTEQLIFPEVEYDKVNTVRGMDITITTNALNDEQGRALLRALGFPFRDMRAES
jgi:large subunit ribosomal protein L5